MQTMKSDPKAIAQVEHTVKVVDQIQRRVTLIEQRLSQTNLNNEVTPAELLGYTTGKESSVKQFEANSTALGSNLDVLTGALGMTPDHMNLTSNNFLTQQSDGAMNPWLITSSD